MLPQTSDTDSDWCPFLVTQISRSRLTGIKWSVSLALFSSCVFLHRKPQTIIEVDANNVEPLVVDEIQIFAGQRYSFVLNANQPVGNYWIRAQPNVGTTGFDGGINSAILRYAGAPIADPTTASSPSNPMLETNLHALTHPAAPGRPTPDGADVSLVLRFEFDIRDLKFKVNGAPFIPPIVPVLLQILTGTRTAQELMPPGSVYVLPPNKVIEISMPGGSTGSPVSF